MGRAVAVVTNTAAFTTLLDMHHSYNTAQSLKRDTLQTMWIQSIEYTK